MFVVCSFLYFVFSSIVAALRFGFGCFSVGLQVDFWIPCCL